MNHAFGVRRLERAGNLQRDVDNLRRVERLARHEGLEVGALQALHRDERPAVVLIDLVHRANLWMVEQGDGSGFAAEPPCGVGVVRELVGKEFQGNTAPEPLVFGVVNHPHPPYPQLADDPVVGDRFSEHK